MNEEELDARPNLHKSLTTPPVLDLPRAEGKLTGDTDACHNQVGRVLLQEQPEGTTEPFGYRSR